MGSVRHSKDKVSAINWPQLAKLIRCCAQSQTGLSAAHTTFCKAAADFYRALKAKSKGNPITRRLMTIPGVGLIVSLSFVALVDNPDRFSKTSDVSAFLGLTPRRHQSGEMNWSGRVAKCGDAWASV